MGVLNAAVGEGKKMSWETVGGRDLAVISFFDV